MGDGLTPPPHPGQPVSRPRLRARPCGSGTPDCASGSTQSLVGDLENLMVPTNPGFVVCGLGLTAILLPHDGCQEHLREFWGDLRGLCKGDIC